MGNSWKLLLLTIILLGGGGVLISMGLKEQGPINILPTPNTVIVNPSPVATTIADFSNSGATPAASRFKELGEVVKVVDGDTIDVRLNGQVKRLRYIGVNTPETVDPRRGVECFGKEASEENKKIVGGQTVFLEKDVSDTDRYDRLLRYVYLSLNTGEMLLVNDYLVREGFAQVSTYPPDVKYVERFKDAENEARNNNKGLWGKCK